MTTARRTTIALLTLLAMAPAAADAKTSAACRKVAKQYRATLPDYSALQPYSSQGEALCFDFTGDGLRDLVVTRWEAMNHGAHYWAAFRHRRNGTYVQIAGMHDCCSSKKRSAGISIDHTGKELQVSQPLYLKGDPLCCPTGGVVTGHWRYRNHRLKLVSQSAVSRR